MRTTRASGGILVLLTATLLAGCSRGAADNDDAPKQSAKAASAAASAPASADAKTGLTLTPQEQKEAGIQVQAAAEADVAATVTLNGTLVPNQDRIANVLPRLAGRIVSAPVPLGATVRAGQTLAVLESIDLGDAQSSYRQARSEVTVADSALERAQKLAVEDIIAQKDLQRARGDAERARAALRAAADKLRLLGVVPAPLEHQRDAIYPVVAPLAGTVIEKHAVPGALAETDPLFVVADLSTVWLEADVFEKDLALLKTGSPATVSVAAYPDRSFPGRLTYVSSTMDTASRTVKARIEVPNADAALKPGMFATARITSSAKVRALLLPAEAVTLMNDKPTVFVLTRKGFEARTVETAARPDGTVEVRAGLTQGDKVAVAGAYALKSRVLKSSLAKDD